MFTLCPLYSRGTINSRNSLTQFLLLYSDPGLRSPPLQWWVAHVNPTVNNKIQLEKSASHPSPRLGAPSSCKLDVFPIKTRADSKHLRRSQRAAEKRMMFAAVNLRMRNCNSPRELNGSWLNESRKHDVLSGFRSTVRGKEPQI